MDGTQTDSKGEWELRLRIDGVESTGKAAMVEAVVEALPGIRWARVDYALAHIDIRGRGEVDEEHLVAAVAGTGCTLSLMGDDDEHPHTAAPDDEHDDDDAVPVIESDDDDRTEPATHEEPEPEEPAHHDRPARPDGDDRPLTDIFGVRPGDKQDEEYAPPPAGSINAFGIFAHVALWCFFVSLFWVLVYSVLPVPMTVPMFSDAVFENGVRNNWVPLTRISPNLIRAVIASEDNEFCHHYGFDFEEINDAIRDAQRGRRQRGASTISQQTAKNAFLWTDHSWLRKGLEAYFTLMIETIWTKRRIMEVYLNIAEWGPGIYGAEAASRHWFHKPASRLSAMEAARLAAILPSGGRWRASGAGPYVVGRAYTIMARANSVDLNGDDRCARIHNVESAMAENQTKPTKLSVSAFVKAVPDARMRADAAVLIKVMQEASKLEPVMWGPAIIGFGSTHYKYESGREGDMPLIAFSPRKRNLVLYLSGLDDELEPELKKLGPHSTGKVCLYISRLADIDMATLKKMIAKSLARMKKRAAAA